MRWPLRNQILLPLLAVSLTSVMVIGGAGAWLAADASRDRIVRQLQGVTALLADSNFPLTPAVLRQMRGLSGAEFVLTDAQGRVSAASLADPPAALSVDRLVESPRGVSLRYSVSVGGVDYFHTAVRAKRRPGARGAELLHVLLPRDQYRASQRAAIGPPLVVGLVSLAAVVAVAHRVAARIGRTTSRIEEEVQRLSEGDYSPLRPPPRDDELRDLTGAINRTAERLEQYEQEVRRTEQARTVALLGAGLAHEMRNAATGCRMALDLHGEACNVSHDQALTVAMRQLALIETQLQRYLRMGRASSADQRQTVDLNRLVQSVMPLVKPAAEHAAVSVTWSPSPEAVVVLADADSVAQVVMNLLQNAIEAARQHAAADDTTGRVRVACAAQGATAEVLVSDNGPGPDEHVAHAVFEPFVTSKAEGVGLGLALSRQVAEEHGGSVEWGRAGGMTCFRLVLPLAVREAAHG